MSHAHGQKDSNVKKSILYKANYRFEAISIKISTASVAQLVGAWSCASKSLLIRSLMGVHMGGKSVFLSYIDVSLPLPRLSLKSVKHIL